MSFRVELDIFRGPLDLLLYLVRKHEVEVTEIPVATITEQFLEFLEILQELDVNLAADFIEMASTLMELKSRLVLPQGGEETEELEDVNEELVERLLMYKNYRDAASILEERSRHWQQRLPRLADDLPPRRIEPAMQPIHEVELWDLVSAFGRIARDSQVPQAKSIVYDETPIHVHMERIHEQLKTVGRASFSQMFQPNMHKSTMIGVFLAILELVRHYSVRTDQQDIHGEIWILPGEKLGDNLDLSNVDNYGELVGSAAGDSTDDQAA
jgi:segregation and condensation protein A